LFFFSLCSVRKALTACGVAAQIRLYDLVHCRLDQGRFPPAPDGTTITALAFSGGGNTLAATTAGGHLLLYQVQSGPPHSQGVLKAQTITSCEGNLC